MQKYFIKITHQYYTVTFSSKGLSELDWPTPKKPPFPELKIQEGENGQLIKQFLEKFSNKNFKKADILKNKILLDLAGTEFQQKVWQAIKTIPVGKTLSYKQLAQKINNPKAVRAVGGACGKNPVPILIPCHRVVASGGKIGGFSGELATKKELLEKEGFFF